MPQVVINDAQGLYQKAGSGVVAQGNCRLIRGALELEQVAAPANDTTVTVVEAGKE